MTVLNNMYTVPGVTLKINFSAGVSGNWRKLRNSVRPWLFHKKIFSKLVLHIKSNALTVYKGTYVLDDLCGILIGLVHSPLIQNFMENLVTTLVSSISLPLHIFCKQHLGWHILLEV